MATYALDVGRVIAAPAETIFDSFVALYDSDRPDWVTDSDLDLRPGGRWSVGLRVPGGAAFREERLIAEVDRPWLLAYAVTVRYADESTLDTTVRLTVEEALGGHRIRVAQQGFPTERQRDEYAAAWPDVLAELDRRVS